jgi:hypothetical protein
MIRMLILIPLLSGCMILAENNSLLSKRTDYLIENKDLDPRIKENIKQGRIVLGMTTKQVYLIKGAPKRRNSSVSIYGKSEQWVYERYYGKICFEYFYFDNGILTSWQDLN